jgi:hypothetical protein
LKLSFPAFPVGTGFSPDPQVYKSSNVGLGGDSPRRRAAVLSGTAMHGFHLSKWYLDCACPGREAFIGYCAELRWKRISAQYASAMVFAGGRLVERSTLKPDAAPQFANGLLSWDCEALATRGTWNSSSIPPGSRVLHRDENGSLEWHCLQPSADARLRCGSRELCGRGYSEYLSLTIPPWNLPIDELRWGRAHFQGRSIVWIDWTGQVPKRLVLSDGKEVEGRAITESLIECAGFRVTLSGSLALREGPVSGMSAGKIPGIRQALSRARLLLDEHKWISDATLNEGGTTLAGTAIHEVVKWR